MLRSIILNGRNLCRRLPIAGYNSCMCSSSTNNEPVKFSMSKASQWKASYTRSGEEGEDESPWFQPYITSASVGIFLIYFCILREENDIDELFSTPLFDRIDGLEEVQLRKVLAYNLDNGIDTRAITARLKELEDMKVKNEHPNV